MKTLLQFPVQGRVLLHTLDGLRVAVAVRHILAAQAARQEAAGEYAGGHAGHRRVEMMDIDWAEAWNTFRWAYLLFGVTYLLIKSEK